MTPIRLIQPSFIIIFLLLIVGCATNRSHTALYEEDFQINFIERYKENIKSISIPGVSILKELSAIGIEKGFQWESKKYNMQYVALVNNLSFSEISYSKEKGQWNLDSHGYIAIIRTISPKTGNSFLNRIAKALRFFEAPDKLEPINSIMPTKQNSPVENKENKNKLEKLKEIDDWLTQKNFFSMFGLNKAQNDKYLGLIALIRITPTGHGNCFLELLGYRYSSLKAKNLSIPLFEFETKSVLSIEIIGPEKDQRFEGGQFKTIVNFELKWDRSKSAKGLPSEWVIPEITKRKRSLPFRTWDMKDFAIRVVVNENSSIKKNIEKIAKSAENIEIN